jgi:transcriptional regulator with PAS, ATPase and Fis domain
MLDFFVARYFLLKNKKDLARFYFAQLLKNCEKFNAIGRLKFEMQFAIELSFSSFLDFTYPRQIINATELRKSLENAMIPSKIDLYGLNRIIGNSKAIKEVKKKIKLFSDIQRPILLIGETGAGKEILAQAIHEESIYKNKPFLAINCGALTDTLLQSELFGYEAGAFTGAIGTHKGIFEAAEDGVVFLDEFGEMSSKLQVSLLRILENNEVLRVGGTKVKEIKCRIIAATNANIEDLIQKKLFREDLYYRLKQFSIIIPPLRDRIEDIPELINYFLNLTNKGQAQIFSDEVMLKFQEYHWPGNIRELKNEIDRIKILCGNKPIIELNDLDIEWIEKKITLPEIKISSLTSTENNKYEQMHQRIMKVKLSSNEKRQQQITLLFQQYKQLNRIQIAEALEVSLLTITRDLKRLCADGIIVKRMPTLSPKTHFFEIKDS